MTDADDSNGPDDSDAVDGPSSSGDDESADAELDVEDAGGTLSVAVTAVLTGGVVTALGVPLLGLGWTGALGVGLVAGAVAAIAAALGSRHASPE